MQDGRNALQLTSFKGRRGGTPAWSPDGQSIAFDLRTDDGRGDIYVIPARGGAPVRVTTDPADDLVPSWSRDGRSIYFGSTRSGRYRDLEGVAARRRAGASHPATVALTPKSQSTAATSTTQDMAPSWAVTLARAGRAAAKKCRSCRDIASYWQLRRRARRASTSRPHLPGSPLAPYSAMFTPFTRPEATIDFSALLPERSAAC